MDFRQLVLQNRSYRKYDQSKPISADTMRSIVEVSRYTASKLNLQTLKYFVSCTPVQNEKIFSKTRWAAPLKGYDGPQKGEKPTGYVVICGDSDTTPKVDTFDIDVGIVAQTMTLYASSLGLGCCMILNFRKEELKALLQLPENLYPHLVVAFGTPDEKVVLVDMEKDGDPMYYRDAQQNHYVPKRKVEDLIVNPEYPTAD